MCLIYHAHWLGCRRWICRVKISMFGKKKSYKMSPMLLLSHALFIFWHQILASWILSNGTHIAQLEQHRCSYDDQSIFHEKVSERADDRTRERKNERRNGSWHITEIMSAELVKLFRHNSFEERAKAFCHKVIYRRSAMYASQRSC